MTTLENEHGELATNQCRIGSSSNWLTCRFHSLRYQQRQNWAEKIRFRHTFPLDRGFAKGSMSEIAWLQKLISELPVFRSALRCRQTMG
jgi:hypothetical protein